MDKLNLNIVVTNTELEPCKLMFDIEVAADSVKRAYDATVVTLNKKVKLPGFRSGKVPRQILESRFGKELEGETIENLIQTAFRQALKEQDVAPFGAQPQLPENFVPVLKQGEPFKFAITFEVYPTFELPQYEGLNLTKQSVKVDDEEIEGFLQTMRENHTEYNVADKPAEKGDMLKADYQATLPEGLEEEDKPNYLLKGENSWVMLREPELFPGITTILAGLKAGDEKDAEITFPETHYNQALKGKTLQYHFKVNEVHGATLPELNDEFAKKFGLDSLNALKDAYRSNQVATLESQAKSDLYEQIRNILAGAADFPLPPSIVADATARTKARLEQQAKQEGKSEDEIKEMSDELTQRAEAQARNNIRAEMIISKIANKESIGVDYQEVMKTIGYIAQRENKTPENAFKALQKNGVLDNICAGILTNSTLDFIISKANVTTAE